MQKQEFNPYEGYLLSDKNITEDKDNWKSVYIKVTLTYQLT